MARFLSEDMAQLTRQLLYAPSEQRAKHLINAERLFWEIEPDANYPLAYVIWRLTQTRVELTSKDTILVGQAVRQDLMELFERVSDSLNESFHDHTPRPLDLEAVCKRLRVSAKTISRYRRQGLFTRHLIWPNGRKRIGFLPESVERFQTHHPFQQKSHPSLQRVDSETRHRLIMRARRLASRIDTSPFRVARHLARRTGRSTETIRKILIEYDQQDPRTAIFPEHTPPLDPKQQAAIERAYHTGVSVASLADRFGRTRNAIYRTLNVQRIQRLLRLNIQWVHHPTFERPDAHDLILGPTLSDLPARATSGVKMTEPFDPQTEQALFLRYNYLKYLAAQDLQTLNESEPKSSRLDQIQTTLRRATVAGRHLVGGFEKWIAAVAKQQLAGKRNQDQWMAPFQTQGHRVLLEAIETFDTTRRTRFSIYLTWALRRRLFQIVQNQPSVDLEPPTSKKTMRPAPSTPLDLTPLPEPLGQWMAGLDSLEQQILCLHMGFDDQGGHTDPIPLDQVAAQLNLSIERVRQIEHQALWRMRAEARRQKWPLTDNILWTE